MLRDVVVAAVVVGCDGEPGVGCDGVVARPAVWVSCVVGDDADTVAAVVVAVADSCAAACRAPGSYCGTAAVVVVVAAAEIGSPAAYTLGVLMRSRG